VPDDPTIDAILADFADHLVPEAFVTRTRAHRVWLEPVDLTAADLDGGGTLWFGQWVEDRIVDALEAAWPHDRPLAVAFTSDGHLLRRYDECGCSDRYCGWWPAGREAAAIGTPWVFAADLPRPQPRWRVRYDDDGDEVDEVLVAPTETRWTMTWYAEARGRGAVASRAGVLEMDGEVVVGSARIPVRASAITREFHRMLFRHPARKRHPLR
jgi:hypothetical protein